MKTIELKPYDSLVTDAVFDELFTKGLDREDGLKEIPADSLQLVVSALEYIRWDVPPTFRKERDALNYAICVVEQLRNKQQIVESNRRRKEEQS